MRKKILSGLLILILCVCAVTPAFAERNGLTLDISVRSRLVDNAELLSSWEASSLLEQLDAISEKHRLDVVVVTADTLDGKSPMDYADDFYDYNGYGFGSEFDGVLLLVSMEDRDWWISTCGYGITAFTDAGIDYIGEQIVPDLSNGYYADAFERYAELCDEFVTMARNGSPYDVHNLPKEPFDFGFSLMISLLVGFAFAFIATGVMRAQLKSVRSQYNAAEYVKAGSMNIRESRDLFLYRDVKRREKPKDNGGGSSTHRSSSGRSHGGGGGKF